MLKKSSNSSIKLKSEVNPVSLGLTDIGDFLNNSLGFGVEEKLRELETQATTETSSYLKQRNTINYIADKFSADVGEFFYNMIKGGDNYCSEE